MLIYKPKLLLFNNKTLYNVNGQKTPIINSVPSPLPTVTLSSLTSSFDGLFTAEFDVSVSLGDYPHDTIQIQIYFPFDVPEWIIIDNVSSTTTHYVHANFADGGADGEEVSFRARFSNGDFGLYSNTVSTFLSI